MGATGKLWFEFVVAPKPSPDLAAQSPLPRPSANLGRTERLRGYPIVEQLDQHRNNDSWPYPVTDEDFPVIAPPIAGFLISPAVA